jgi:UPF0755 protein
MKKKLNKLFLLIIVLAISIFSLMVIFISLFQAKDASDPKLSKFIIPRGQAISIIGQNLKEEGFIRSSLAFRYAVKKNNLEDKIQSGSFELSPSMTTWEIATALTKGTDDLWITIPEGWRREEIAASLAKQDLSLFDEDEFLILTKGLEGQLFPDTYLVSRESSTKQIVSILNNTFESKILTGLSDEIESSDFTVNEILTLASLIQRESSGETEMPLVAGILQNRLDIGMALQVDASLQYIKGYSKTEDSWWPDPLAADKELDSLYNTYKYNSLPPAPICNPGLAAVEAVLNPQETNALFYIHDNSAKIHTAETLEGHNRNVNEYLR